MAWYEIFIVSVGLSLDVFTYALYKGAMLSRLDKKQILKMILLFTGWQSGAMLLGSLISELPYIAMNYQRTERLFRGGIGSYFFPDRDMADRPGTTYAGPAGTKGRCLRLETAMHLGHAYQCGQFSDGNWHGLFRHQSNGADHSAGNYGCAGGHRRHLCGISDRVSWKKPCTDQWSADLPACRRGCIVSILYLKYRDS